RAASVLGGMLALRVVTAPDVAAGEAEPQVDPLHSALEALLAALRGAGLGMGSRGKVGTGDHRAHNAAPAGGIRWGRAPVAPSKIGGVGMGGALGAGAPILPEDLE